MTWFKVDDQFATHQKVVAAGNTAVGLWVRAGSWSAAQLTDGFVPHHMLAILGGKKADARRLVEVGLWHETEGGYLFHQWSDEGRQPTRQSVEERRQTDRERKAEARAERARQVAEERAASGNVRRMSARTPHGIREES
jgi:hypothetical protein